MKTSISERAKLVVEYCGRHPLATGLFAILSLLGVLFGVYGFSLDRIEAINTADQINTVSESIRQLDESVRDVNGSRLDKKFDKPIDIDINLPEYLDSIVFSTTNSIVSETTPVKKAHELLDSIRQSTPHSSSTPYFSFSVRSKAEKSFVQIAPYLLLDVYGVEPIQENLAGMYLGERGGGAVLREFNHAVTPVSGIHIAPMIDSMSGRYKEGVDYLSLEPGEVEEFFLSLTFWPDYYYDFRIGIQIRFLGEDSVIWIDNKFRRGVPSRPMLLYTFSSKGAFQINVHPDTLYFDREKYLNSAQQDFTQYNRSRVFKLGMVGLPGPVAPQIP